jgi:Zn-dependent metalloprotease/chitodextrinase
MKNVRLILVILFFGIFLSFANAQQTKDIIEDVNGNPTFIKFNKTSTKGYSNSKRVLLELYPNEDNESFKLIAKEKDHHGFSHEKYQQYKNGIKVEHGVYTIHLKENVLLSLSGNYLPAKKTPSKSVNLTEEQALQKALEYINASTYMWEREDNEEWAKEIEPLGTFYPKGELVYIKDYLNQDRLKRLDVVLAYKFNIYAQEPLSRDYVYVNAESGDVLFKDAIIKFFPKMETVSAKSANKIKAPSNTKSGSYAATRYSGIQTITTSIIGSDYALRAYDKGSGIETYNMNNSSNYWNANDFTDNNDQWTAEEFDNTSKDNAALDAHWGAGKVWDYWMYNHGRNSYDANKGIIKNYVHYGNNVNDAFWNGSVFSYGDGSSYDATTSLDAVAYAMGHAICDKTANLTYHGESGAITEGLSNIWAACVDHFANINKSIWEIGEDIGGPMYDLSTPNAYNQPDTYIGTNWYTGSGDNGGVHTNSGVLGYWFYLLSEGGSGTNDNGLAFNVNAIGIEKAARITYRTETIYLSSDNQYIDMRTLSIVATEDIFGAGSNEAEQVKNAWDAVGVYAIPHTTSGYCSANSTNTNDEWISSIQIGTFFNSSTSTQYSDFTHLSLDLIPGNVVNVNLIPDFNGGPWTETWTIWIDLNGDKNFDPSTEIVFQGASSSTVTGSFVVPVASATSTRMRITFKYSSYPTSACGSYTYGEVEDYTVNIFNPAAPTAPANLIEVNKTQTSVNLAWDASTDDIEVKGYKVFQDGIEVQTIERTTATINGLNPQTSYIFYVVAYDGDGNISPASNAENIITRSNPDADIEAPSVPNYLNANSITKSSLNLTWFASNDNVGVTGYKIYKDGNFIKSVVETNATIEGLSSETSYSFSVKASDAAGNLSLASTKNITTLSSNPGDTESPSTPQNLSAIDIGETSLKLTWNASTDNVGIEKYRIYMNGGTHSYVTNNSALITGLNAGTQYLFYVRAYDGAGNYSVTSSRLNTTTTSDSDIQSPSTPQNLRVDEKGKTYVRLSWDPSTDNVGVTKYRILKNGSHYSYTTSTSELIQGLTAGNQYYFYVTAYDDAGNISSNSSFLYVTTENDGSIPDGIIFPTYCSSKGNNQTFEWIDYVGLGAIDNNTGKELGGYGDFTSLTPTLLSAHSYTLYLSAGFSSERENEYWRVWIDLNIDGDFNDANELIAEGGPLAYDGTISAPFEIPTSITSGYTVMRVSMKYDGYPSSCGSFEYGEVEDYPIELSNNKSITLNSELSLSNTHNINDPIVNDNSILFPNPASDYIKIVRTNRDQNIQQVSISSMSGEILITKRINTNGTKINVSSLPNGIYTVIIQTDNKTINKKFIKQ